MELGRVAPIPGQTFRFYDREMTVCTSGWLRRTWVREYKLRWLLPERHPVTIEGLQAGVFPDYWRDSYDWTSKVPKVITENQSWEPGTRGNAPEQIKVEAINTALFPEERQALMDWFENPVIEGDPDGEWLMGEMTDWFVCQIQAYNVGPNVEAALRRVQLPVWEHRGQVYDEKENLLSNLLSYRQRFEEILDEAAKHYGVTLHRVSPDDVDAKRHINRSTYSGKEVWLGIYEDWGLKMISFWHEIGHTFERPPYEEWAYDAYGEALAWRKGLYEAGFFGFTPTWDQIAWARKQLGTYFDDNRVPETTPTEFFTQAIRDAGLGLRDPVLMDDRAFISYCDAHRDVPGTMQRSGHLFRLYDLAGVDRPKGWSTMYGDASSGPRYDDPRIIPPLVEAAKARLRGMG